MTEPSTTQVRFQMVGSRAAVLDGPNSAAVEQQIRAIKNVIASVPDFAFDLSRTLVGGSAAVALVETRVFEHQVHGVWLTIALV